MGGFSLIYLLENVGKRYLSPSGEKWALRHVSVSFPSRGLFSIKGVSGSGKSTFLNLLSLLEKPNEGRILFEGKDLRTFSEKEVEDYRNFRCGFVYQHFNLLDELNARENVALPLAIRGEKSEQAFLRADVLFKRFGLEDLKDKKVSLLSGGEKQRVAILRALSASPSVLFADEPTGALDRANEEKIMECLKEISRTCLVVLVSHNERIIQKYSDGVLTLREGRLFSNEGVLSKEREEMTKIGKRGNSRKWVSSLLWRNYKNEWLKNVLALFSGVLGYLSLLLSFGFLCGAKSTLEERKKQNLQYLNASLSLTKNHPIEGSPLSLIQVGRPSYFETEKLLEGIPNLSINVDYSYFLPTYSAYSLNGEKEEPVTFAPVFDITLRERESSFPLEGEVPQNNDLAHVLVNRQFADLFSESPLHKSITLHKNCVLLQDGNTDELSFSFSFFITGIIDEFSFLNVPKVYYSYAGASIFFGECYLDSFSKGQDEPLSVNGFLEQTDGSSIYGNYDYLVFAHDERSAVLLKDFSSRLEAERSPYSLSSSAYAVETAFSSLTASFSMSLTPFLLIEVLGVAFILGSLAYSSFLERKKEAAILWALGARKGDTSFLYEGGPFLTSLLSAGLALLFSLPLEKILSFRLEKAFSIPGLIRIPYGSFFGIPFFVAVVLFAFASIVSFCGASLPLCVAMKANLAEELRDE